MSVQNEIDRINLAKEDIIEAINKKGVETPDGLKIDGVAPYIQGIAAQGGIATSVDENGILHITFVNKSEEESVISKTTMYAASDDNIVPPTDGWNVEIVDAKGRYLWTRHETNMPDGNKYYDYTVGAQKGLAPVTKSITLSANAWQGDSMFQQNVTIAGYDVSEHSSVELRPTPQQVIMLQQLGVSFMQAVNIEGIITVYFGDAVPEEDITLQVVVEEID